MGIEIFELVERVYAGSAEGVISQGFIQRVLLDFEIGPDCILHEVDFLGLNDLYLGQDGLKMVSIHLHHVIVPAAGSAVFLSKWLRRLLQVIDLKV